jgi:hypothetical protein
MQNKVSAHKQQRTWPESVVVQKKALAGIEPHMLFQSEGEACRWEENAINVKQ